MGNFIRCERIETYITDRALKEAFKALSESEYYDLVNKQIQQNQDIANNKAVLHGELLCYED